MQANYKLPYMSINTQQMSDNMLIILNRWENYDLMMRLNNATWILEQALSRAWILKPVYWPRVVSWTTQLPFLMVPASSLPKSFLSIIQHNTREYSLKMRKRMSVCEHLSGAALCLEHLKENKIKISILNCTRPSGRKRGEQMVTNCDICYLWLSYRNCCFSLLKPAISNFIFLILYMRYILGLWSRML